MFKLPKTKGKLNNIHKIQITLKNNMLSGRKD